MVEEIRQVKSEAETQAETLDELVRENTRLAQVGAGVIDELHRYVYEHLSEKDQEAIEREREFHPVAELLFIERKVADCIKRLSPPCWSKLSHEEKTFVEFCLAQIRGVCFSECLRLHGDRMPESESKWLGLFFECLFTRYSLEGFVSRITSQKSTWLNKEWRRFLRFAGVIRIRKEKPAGKGKKPEKKPRGGQIRNEYIYAYKLSLMQKPRGGGPKYLSRIHIIRDVNAAKYKEMEFKSDKGKKVLRRFNAGIRRARAFYGGLYPPKEDYT